MEDFTRKLITEWRRLDLPFSGKKIILAVSGGADSCSMAFALFQLQKAKKITNTFIVAHLNHNLRGQKSLDDASFTEELSNQLNFEFVTQKINSKPSKGKNLEEWARKKRYEFLLKTAERFGSKYILTAHTLNDQAETFLMNLIRGSGLEGLSGMKVMGSLRSEKEVFHVRPMLTWADRNDVTDFIKRNGIRHRNDEMNENSDFRRVKIRKELIPFLTKINPQIVQTLARTSILVGRENELLNCLINQEIDKRKLNDDSFLPLKKLGSLSEAMLYRVLRSWVLKNRGTLKKVSSTHIKSIALLVSGKKSGKFVELPGFSRVVKENGKLLFQITEVEK
jgi:tRNA(Ile)-lysidine synthase